AKALLDEGLQVGAVPHRDFLGQDARVGVALLAVGHAEAGIERRQVLDEADVEGRPGLVVEAALAHEVVDLGLDVGVVHEHAGVIHAEGGERRGQVELDAVDLAVADVGRGEQPAVGRFGGHGVLDAGVLAVLDHFLPCILHLFARLAGVDQFDQILDVAVEDVDADDAALTKAALVAEVEAVGGLGVEPGVADVVVVAVLAVEQRRHQLVEVRALDAARQRQADAVGVGQVPLQVQRRQQFVVVLAGGAFDLPVFDKTDVRLRGFQAQAGFPRQDAAVAGEHQVRVEALFLDHAVDDAVELVGDGIAFVAGFPFVAGVGDIALLVAVVDAEFHLRGIAQVALVRDLEAGLGVLGVDGQGFGFRLVPLAVDVGMFLLALDAAVLEARVVEVELGGAACHVEAVFDAESPVLLVDGGQAGDVGGDHLAVVVFLLERHLGHVAVGLDEEAVDAQPASLADIGGPGDVARVVAAILDFLLVLPADKFFHRRVAEAIGTLDLGAVAVLHVDAGEEAAAQRFAAGDGTEGRIDFAAVPAVHAQAQVAAVECVGVAQDDVDRAGYGIARAFGAVAAQHLDSVDHFSRDAVAPERAVVAGAGHLLAVDQHLGVAAAQAAQLHAVVFHDVRADESRTWDALDHVAD